MVVGAQRTLRGRSDEQNDVLPLQVGSHTLDAWAQDPHVM